MDNNKYIRWNLIVPFVYLNSAFLSFFLLLFSFLEMELGGAGFTYKLFIFIIAPPFFGFLLDYMNRNKRIALLRYYIKALKMSFIMLFAFFLIYFLFPNIQTHQIALVGIVFLFLLINLFYVPVNAFLDVLAPTKQLPFILAIITSSTYSIFLARQDIYEHLFPRLGLWLFFLLGMLTAHAGFLFRKQVRKVKLNFKADDFKATEWNRIIWMAIVLGIGHIALMHIYPKFYLMYNEPHGVSKSQADLFRQVVFFGTIALLLPLGLVVSKYGVSRFIKINNTILILSVLSAVFFPEYFMIETFVSIISLSLAIVTNLPVAYEHVSSKHRALGAGVFFGIVLSMIAIAGCLLK